MHVLDHWWHRGVDRVDGAAKVLRVDRPMAEAAVASGRHVIVAATLPSTLPPTTDLLRQVAAKAGRPIATTELLCADAWTHFERGDGEGYAQAIANAVASQATATDIVVLAQASMAPAEALIEAMGLRVLSSPALGVRAAVRAHLRAAGQDRLNGGIAVGHEQERVRVNADRPSRDPDDVVEQRARVTPREQNGKPRENHCEGG